MAGGLYDALKDTDGEVLVATNEQAAKANELFIQSESNDIHPAAAIATASLINTVNKNKKDKDALIMLNITGGGEERFKNEHVLYFLKPSLIFDIDVDIEDIRIKVNYLNK